MPSYKSPIIDSCIAASASEKGTHKDAVQAWGCLEKIRKTEVVIILSEELKKEWLDNGSRSSKLWLSSMINKKRTKPYQDNGLYNQLNKKINKSNANNSEKREMKKDVHLLGAALANDKTIISNEKKAPKLFKKHIDDDKVQNVFWVNPKIKKDTLHWIGSGLPHEDDQKIKNQDF